MTELSELRNKGLIEAEKTAKLLNKEFKKFGILFTVEGNGLMPTIKINLIPNKYFETHFVSYTDTFHNKVKKLLNAQGIKKFSYNNTNSTFWWHITANK